MYYLVEKDVMTGEWSTNFTMYDTDPDYLMKRIAGDRMYIREWDSLTAPTAIQYRIIHPRDSFLDKFVCVIQSVI